VTLRLNENEKDSVVVLARMTANGKKPPLFGIAKGKTEEN
jgi:hypothetical protein